VDENNQNILYAGKEELTALLNSVNELDGFKARIDELEVLCERSRIGIGHSDDVLIDGVCQQGLHAPTAPYEPDAELPPGCRLCDRERRKRGKGASAKDE